MAGERDEQKYTNPELRERIKERLRRSSKGGRPGEWSARKSQLLVQEYERSGGGYVGEKDAKARSLERWTEQQWQTRGGSADARAPGARKRYLPKAAWERLSPSERRQAERSKRRAEARGRHRAEWPAAVKRVMRDLRTEGRTKSELYDRAKQLRIEGRSKMTKDELARAVRRREGR